MPGWAGRTAAAGAVDTAMMAQNALVAAESLGLGGVYIGDPQ
jgi:nitroreductase